MVPMRRSALRACFIPLLAIGTLWGSAPVAEAASTSTRKERIEEIWLDAKGESGRIRTTPLYLDDAPGEYHFGPSFCRKGHRLGADTLRAVQSALAAGLPVRIDAEPFAGGEGPARQCVTGVAFFAPLP